MPSSAGGGGEVVATTTSSSGQPARGQVTGGPAGGGGRGGELGGAGIGGGESVLVRLTSTVQCGYVAQSSCSAITLLRIAITPYLSPAV